MTMNNCKIQLRCTPQEKQLFRLAADEAGFRSLSEWIRVSATEYIREHLGIYIKEKTKNDN